MYPISRPQTNSHLSIPGGKILRLKVLFVTALQSSVQISGLVCISVLRQHHRWGKKQGNGAIIIIIIIIICMEEDKNQAQNNPIKMLQAKNSIWKQ